MKFLSL